MTPASVTLADVVPLAAPREEIRPALGPSSTAQPECTVGPRETLWSIAERHLGDPRRWPEIFKLNEGRPQDDGGSLTNPRRIRSGWTLRLPADVAGPTAGRGSTVVVAPGDSLSALARRHLGDARRWPEVFQLNRGTPQPDGRSLQDPDLIRPLWVLRLSIDGLGHEPAPASEAAAAPHGMTSSSGPPPSPLRREASGQQAPAPTPPATVQPAPGEPGSAGENEGTNPGQALTVLGTGLAAVGVVVALDRLRRARSRRRLPGRPPALPDPALADGEIRLRAEAGEREADVDRLDVCLRALGAALAREPERPYPSIVAVQVAPDGIEFLLAEPCPSAPNGFASTDNGWTWRIDTADVDALRPAADRVAPLPALVTLGTGVGGTVLVDLEAAGLVAIDGDPGEARHLLHQFVLELGTSTWADHVDVVVIGNGFSGIDSLPRMRHAPDVMAVIDELEPTAAARREALGNLPSTFAARTTSDGGDGWAPTLVVCAETPDDQTAGRLAALAGGGGMGIGIVVAGPFPAARWTLHCEAGTIETDPLGLRLHRAGLTEETLETAEELLVQEAAPVEEEPAVAAATEEATAEPPPSGMDRVVVLPGPAPSGEPADEPADEPFAEAPFEVEVRVLGPVEVVGSDQPVEGGRPLDLIAYLALHPEGADGDRLRTVLWPPDRPAPAAKTFANVISLTRGLMGARHFPQATTEIYRLGGTVTTDIARFKALVAHAQHQGRTKAMETFRSALNLVRGEPFAAVQGFNWVPPEGHQARVEALVVDNAHRMVELCLAAGDPTGADWAAHQGLLASPANEILYRDRMLAADAAGNPAGVEAAMAELCDVLEADDPTDRVHPDTLALYEELVTKWSKRATG